MAEESLQNNFFDTEYLKADLKGRSVRGGMTTMSAQVIKFILSTTGIVVLARLLTPNDYGLIGMVAVVVNFAAMFKDAGLSMATVQKDKITHDQISTLFWINILISAFLGICILTVSPLVARFYGRPELTAVTAALSVSFIISGLMIQHQALMRRHMQFGKLAIIQIASQVITLVVTIVLALQGWRYWALVGGSISTALAGLLLTFFFCP
ncbi:oligosaccharide flippase family protein, partial [Planctomycetota bacterium]